MIPVRSVHMAGASVVVAGVAGTRLVEEMASQGGQFGPVTTLNTAACDLCCPSAIGFPSETTDMQERLTSAYCKMGAFSLHSCTPYYVGNIPQAGEHVAWGESSAIVFANSVLGARTNREGGPTGLAAALTGYVPEYGLHLEDNRRGQVVIKVEDAPSDIHDYGTLGYHVGQICRERIPVFVGIERPSMDELKMLGAALASSGAVGLFHIVGVTPEAMTLEAAMGGLRAEEEITYGAGDKQAALCKLDKATAEEADLVALGCPHASINEVKEITHLLNGQHVRNGLKLWVMTSLPMRALASRMGFVSTIQEAGAQVVCDTCVILAAMKPILERDGINCIATNSAKLAHYAPGQWSLDVHYGSLDTCIRAAVTGRWRSECVS